MPRARNIHSFLCNSGLEELDVLNEISRFIMSLSLMFYSHQARNSQLKETISLSTKDHVFFRLIITCIEITQDILSIFQKHIVAF